MPFEVGPLVVPATTALLINEMQGTTTASTEPGSIGEGAVGVLPNIVRLAEAARAVGVQVMHCVILFRRDSLAKNRNVLLYRLRGGAPTEEQRPDSRPIEGSVPHPDLGPDDRDIVMTRYHGIGSVADTGVAPVLRNLGITTVVVTGISLNIGVPNAVMDLVNQSFDVVVPRDAVAGTPADYGKHMLRNTIGLLATLTTTDELMSAWSAGN
jgi:nicotinamidase-related amidase